MTESEPLVLLPGMNCSGRLWGPVGDDAIVVPTLTECSVEAQVDRLLDECPARFALAGLSLGGVVAMALVRRAPDRVSRLALLATNPRAPTRQQLDAWRSQRDRLASGASARDLQRDGLPELIGPATVAARPTIVETVLAMADDVGAERLDAQLQMQASRIDARAGLRHVRCPTLIVAGEHDAMCSVHRHREINDLVPDAHLTVLPNVGHLIPLEAPIAVAGEVQALLLN